MLALMCVPVLQGATREEANELKNKADQGDVTALNEIVKLCQEESDTLTDKEKAHYCLKAAGKLNYDAQVLLYAYFSQGRHMEKNPAMAESWQEGILNSGSADAVFKLAKWKLEKGDSDAERSSGRELCRKAADMGSADAREYMDGEAKRMEEEAKLAAEKAARLSGPLSDGNIRNKVSAYLAARANGDSYQMLFNFAPYVTYKYSGKKPVARDAVLRDIESGWQRWVSRSYRLIRVGVKGRTVEVVFSYNLSDANGKSAFGYSKEIWQLDHSAQIVTWDEHISKKSAPDLSAGFDAIY